MSLTTSGNGLRRRSLLKAGLAVGISQVTSPFVLRARAAEVVKIGIADPLTGAYAALGKSELIGCRLAVEQMNEKGGILGRKVELVVEDSTSGDAGTAVQKARKLIDVDKVDFLLGNANSALSLAMAQVSNEKNILHIVALALIPTQSPEPLATGMSFASATRRRRWPPLSPAR